MRRVGYGMVRIEIAQNWLHLAPIGKNYQTLIRLCRQLSVDNPGQCSQLCAKAASACSQLCVPALSCSVDKWIGHVADSAWPALTIADNGAASRVVQLSRSALAEGVLPILHQKVIQRFVHQILQSPVLVERHLLQGANSFRQVVKDL